jgi:hypothetical protein
MERSDIDYFEEESNYVRKFFDVEEMLNFQLTHDVQVIRGEDYSYYCYVNKKCIITAFTPMFALVRGIKYYKEKNGTE